MADVTPVQPKTVRETLFGLTTEVLKKLKELLGAKGMSATKADLADGLAVLLLDPAAVRERYAALDETSRLYVREAAHSADGTFDLRRFEAKYGAAVVFQQPTKFGWGGDPTPLRAFCPVIGRIPTDLRRLLLLFVPPPPALDLAVLDVPPETVTLPRHKYADPAAPVKTATVRVRHTARAASADVKSVLRLVESGAVKVGESTRRPSAASVKAIAAVLSDGDFYGDDDRSEQWKGDPAGDPTILPFAWAIIVQAAGLAEPFGAKLALTDAGRKALSASAPAVLAAAWKKWMKATLLDEFSRVEAIKGQSAKGALAPLAPRRKPVIDALAAYPAGKWVSVADLLRRLKVEGDDYVVARDDEKLYIGSPHYGILSQAKTSWDMVEGRYAPALLFEYAAALGLIDVAYTKPQETTRTEFHADWGTDDYRCLSRYDGLTHVRVNALGAWVLGLAAAYVPEAVVATKSFRALANFDVVAADGKPPAADVLVLERFAERRSEAVWHLSREKLLSAVESGLSVFEAREFLASASRDEIPANVAVFFEDVALRAGALTDRGAARLVECRDAVTAQTLANDRKLRGLVRLAGERDLVFAAADEAAVRKALRELGYALPPA